jgi:hypothetical protein
MPIIICWHCPRATFVSVRLRCNRSSVINIIGLGQREAQCRRQGLYLCVPKVLSMSCDQTIFIDQATGASLISEAMPRKIDGLGFRLQRRGTVQGAVWAVLPCALKPYGAF